MLLQAREAKSYSAVVDSGASTSAFPLSVAAELGIDRSEMVRDPKGVYGLVESESNVPAFRARYITINAQVMADTGSEEAERFGPQFALDAVFLEGSDRFLLGRADFFRVFCVQFPIREPRVVVLSY